MAACGCGTGNCSNCAGANCSGGCDGTCNGCETCTSSCGSGCGGNCTSCSGYDCGGSCSGGCSGGCKGSCKDTCDTSCSNCAGNGCSGSCGSGCSAGCGNDCSGACNKTCDGGVQDTNFANLKLEKLFKKDNIQNIADFIKFELENRRDLTAIDISFVKKTRIDESKILDIIKNLETLKHPITESEPIEKQKGYAALALNIIQKAKDAYNELVPPNT